MAIEKMVVARKEASEQLSAACRHNAKDLGAAVEREFRAILGRKAVIPPMAQFIEILGESLAEHARRLEEINNTDGDDRRANRPVRQRRSALIKQLVEHMGTLRSSMLTVYPVEVAARLELSQPLPISSQTKMLRLTGAFLEKGKDVLAEATPRPGLELDVRYFINLLQGLFDEITEIVGDLRKEEQEARKSKARKKKALQAFDAHFKIVAPMAAGIFRLGGHPELVNTIRPKRGRRATKKVEEQPTPVATDATKRPT